MDQGTLSQALLFKHIGYALVFSLIGVIVLAISFVVFDKITPGNLWKEIEEEQNIALAIVVGAMSIAISHIIASAIHG